MNPIPIRVNMRLLSEETIIPMTYTSVVQFIENVNWYEGDYEFTPSQQQQTISIADLMARQDIVIDPIPNNYGLITYDGSTITVS